MNTKFLKKIFYLPNYLSLPAAGIEICNRSIKYIEFYNKSGIFSIKNFGQIALAPNVVQDGSILNKNALVKALLEVKKAISSDFVKVSVPEEKTYIFDSQISKEARTNIREALEFKIEENVPLKLDEIYFEYGIVDEFKIVKDIIVDVSVIPKRIIADYSEALELAQMYPVSFELESKMITSAVITKGDRKNSIIVNIKDDTTVLIAVIDGHVRLTSSISIGESTIKDNLLKTGLLKEGSDISKFFENDFSFETLYTKDVYVSLVNVFSILKDEVEKFNEYVVNKFPNTINLSTKNIERIILCGKSSTLPGLSKHINQKINAEVVVANVWSNVFDIKDHSPTMKFNESLGFVTPIGLVISSYKQNNA